jgi:hypothetical protein
VNPKVLNWLSTRGATSGDIPFVGSIKNYGPRFNSAGVRLQFSRSRSFRVICETEDRREMEAEGFLRGVARGVLEGLNVGPAEPPPGIEVRVVGTEIDPVTSTEDVFRLAAQQATSRFLAGLP